MILIADSGSTKTHWCLMAANGHCSEYLQTVSIRFNKLLTLSKIA